MNNYCYNCMKPIEAGAATCPHCGQATRVDAPAHQLKPGTLLRGRYLIGKALGQGGFGITYIGLDTTLNLRVAIKEYYLNGYANRNHEVTDNVTITASDTGLYQKGRKQFLKEARTLARFYGEPGIVSVHDFFEANNTAYIVMEYLDGVTLKTLVAPGKTLSGDKLQEVMKPLLSSLAKVHAQGVIHRDISPDNIMVLRDGSLKLLDFGAAREVNGDKSLSVMLKPGYAPEEQYRSKGRQGPWTDIYALCATMYFCVTGEKPDESVERMVNDTLKRPTALGAKVSPAMESAILRGMAVRADERYQSVQELLNALCEEPKSPPPPPPPPAKRWLYVMLAALLIVAALTVTALTRGHATPVPESPTPVPETAAPTATVTPTSTVAPTSTVTPTSTAAPETPDKTAQESETAEERYRKAAEAGDAAAMSQLGTLYYQGNGVPQDYQQALQWFLEAERSGNTEVWNIIGYMYETGLGTSADPAQAATWYQKAAEAGDERAGRRLQALREKEKESARLTGTWGAQEAIHKGTTSAFYLDAPLYNCDGLTMSLRIAAYTGYPFGDWYLYMLNTEGDWISTEIFQIRKEQANGEAVIYNFAFDRPMSFKALAICPAENGMEFTMERELLFYDRQSSDE